VAEFQSSNQCDDAKRRTTRCNVTAVQLAVYLDIVQAVKDEFLSAADMIVDARDIRWGKARHQNHKPTLD